MLEIAELPHCGPAVVRKGDLLLTIYVDDSLINGPNKQECDEARLRILEKFSGKSIEPVYEENGTVEVRDVLGLTVKYNRKKRYLKISLEENIRKVLKKFNMEGCKSVSTPCIPMNLAEGKKADKFPIRQLVGALQYVASMVRCDIAYTVRHSL